MWEGNKSQAGSLESIILVAAKRILGCSSKICNEAVRADMGLYPVYTRSKNSSRTVLRVDVNADGSVPNRSVPPRTEPPRGGSLRSVTVPFDSYWRCVKL